MGHGFTTDVAWPGVYYKPMDENGEFCNRRVRGRPTDRRHEDRRQHPGQASCSGRDGSSHWYRE
eukprot:3680029-Heterocapsa_arctica.AAC.1